MHVCVSGALSGACLLTQVMQVPGPHTIKSTNLQARENYDAYLAIVEI
jgi:hypothetical protein